MKKFYIVTISLILAVFTLEMALPSQVQAAQLRTLDQNSLNNLTLTQTYDGKLVHATDAKVKPHRVIKAVITAYSSTPDQTDDDPFIAASGKRVHDGMIAANGIPFGTKIKIPSLYGEKVFIVEDRMNARYGYGRMDIWMSAPRKQVMSFGVKKVDVEIYYVEKTTQIAKVDSI
ncbi:MAG: hypothetical protein ACD_72C00180G0002 [uncultured bacterium]|nr:MAG: hypothetical protein ACD_72C00180G0002 [uncultured bacterium]